MWHGTKSRGVVENIKNWLQIICDIYCMHCKYKHLDLDWDEQF